MSRRRPSLYLISILLFMFLFPVASILVEWLNHQYPIGWPLVGKWFVFWSVGVRLFIAGIRQVLKPQFTAQQIFHIQGDESYPVIRELGFANLSIGTIGILSIAAVAWSELAAIAGALFFGLAGLLHVFRRPDSKAEVIAMVSDLYLFVILLFFLIFTLA